MISCRVVLNELPDDVVDHVMCVDEVVGSDSRWKVLSRSDSSLALRFVNKPGAPSWFVRWGFNYSWNHFRESLLGRDDATLDWQRTTRAERRGIPVARYRFLATPRLLTGSMDTLLVTEFIEHTSSAAHYIETHRKDELFVNRMMVRLGELLAQVHDEGIVHGNFVLDSVLIQYDDPTRLTLTDWYDSTVADDYDDDDKAGDVRSILRDLDCAGLRPGDAEAFFRAYAAHEPWAEGRFGEFYLDAVGRELTRH